MIGCHWSEAHAEQMILFLQQGLLSDGITVPITKLCAWFGVPRRTFYYKPEKVPPKIDPAFEKPIKAIPLAHAGMRCRAVDRGGPFVRLSHRCLAARVQQEHSATDLPTQELAGA